MNQHLQLISIWGTSSHINQTSQQVQGPSCASFCPQECKALSKEIESQEVHRWPRKGSAVLGVSMFDSISVSLLEGQEDHFLWILLLSDTHHRIIRTFLHHPLNFMWAVFKTLYDGHCSLQQLGTKKCLLGATGHQSREPTRPVGRLRGGTYGTVLWKCCETHNMEQGTPCFPCEWTHIYIYIHTYIYT